MLERPLGPFLTPPPSMWDEPILSLPGGAREELDKASLRVSLECAEQLLKEQQ